MDQRHGQLQPLPLAQRCIQAGCPPLRCTVCQHAPTDSTRDCGHNAYRPGLVLDPFSGSGTTGLAALTHHRDYVGIDLNAEYLDLSLTTRLQHHLHGKNYGRAA